MATPNRGSKPPRGGSNRPGGAPPSGGRPPQGGAARGGGTRQAAATGTGNGGQPTDGSAASAGRGPTNTRGASTPSGGAPSAPRRLGQQQSNAPRRVGQQPARRPQSAGAQRRNKRRRTSSTKRYGWLGVLLVVAVIATFVAVKASSSNSPSTSSGAGRTPDPAPASIVNQLTSTPLALQSAQGTAGQTTSPYINVSNPVAISSTSKPRIAFIGAEFCPYCAVERYPLILALSRLGTFHHLGVTVSGSADGDIPTFSFLGSSYTSKYVTFTPYEEEDRNRKLLETPPANLVKLWHAEEYQVLSAQGSVADEAWPWLDLSGKYVLTSFPASLDTTLADLEGSNGQGVGLTRSDIVSGIRNPASSTGQTINASGILVEANFVDAAICQLDGGKPASVCSMPGVKAAMKVIATAKPTKVPTSLPNKAPAALNQVN